VVADETGAVVKVVSYDAFGNVQSDSNPAFELPLGYAGGIADPVTGLVRMGFRDYEPATGRFTARDPLLFNAGQTNLYAYSGNDPIGHRDPSGLFCVSASSYQRVGVGTDLCITEEGISVCGEVGFGFGKGSNIVPKQLMKELLKEAGLSPGGLKPNSQSVGFQLKHSCGILGLSVGGKLDQNGCVSAEAALEIGPFSLTIDEDGEVDFSPEFSKSGWDTLKDWWDSTAPDKKASKPPKWEKFGKIFGKVCGQAKY
jgi:RHS repeat-associated protein